MCIRDSLNTCRDNTCGDGVIDNQGPVSEGCDDGNNVDTDGCRNSCELPTCGDLFVSTGLGETCDDGNSSNLDDCPNACVANVCGDGVRDLQGPRTDTCDDGNGSNADDCVDLLGQCRPATCGDGFIDSQGPVTEACDDGDTDAGDGCDGGCVVEAGFTCLGVPSVCM